jgi:hypothetical protein
VATAPDFAATFAGNRFHRLSIGGFARIAKTTIVSSADQSLRTVDAGSSVSVGGVSQKLNLDLIRTLVMLC